MKRRKVADVPSLSNSDAITKNKETIGTIINEE